MRVLLMRHFTVDFCWKDNYNHKGYMEALKTYNKRPVINIKELDFPIKTIYISSLSRTRETAGYLKGEKEVIQTDLIDEIDLQGSGIINYRLPVKFCHRFALLKSILNLKSQNETRKETKARAKKFLRLIEDKNEDCIVISHGMFLKVLMRIMIRRGYSSVTKIRALKNGEIVEYNKDS